MPDTTSPSAWKARGGRLAKPVGAWIAGILAAVVATVIAAWILAPEEARTDPDALPFTVAVDAGHAAFPGWVLDQPPDRAEARPPSSVDWTPWATRTGAVPVPRYGVTLTVQGTSAAQVTLTGLKVRVVDRQPAMRGVQYLAKGAGSTVYRWVLADLDRDPPEVTTGEDPVLAEWVPEVERKPIRFPYEISLSDAESFLIEATTVDCLCSWVIDLSWAAMGRTGVHTIDNQGQPFRVTGLANVDTVCNTAEGTGESCNPKQ